MSNEYFSPPITNDYILDMVEKLGENLGKSIFEVENEITPISIDSLSEKDIIIIKAGKLLNNNKFNEAEDLIFEFSKIHRESIDKNFIDWFYDILENKTDDILLSNNFSRKEITLGRLELYKLIDSNF